MVFIDTPGIHKPQHRLGEYMVVSAQRTLQEVDLILYVIDAAADFGPGEEYILNQLSKVQTPVLLVINKIDLIKPGAILAIIEQYRNLGNFAEIIPVSAKAEDNLDRLSQVIFKYLPEGPCFYPSEDFTDQPERLMAELIREKVILLTRKRFRIPWLWIWRRLNHGIMGLFLCGRLFISSGTPKGILIGKRGVCSRKWAVWPEDIQNLLGSQIFLELWVKVKRLA